ncbi:leucine zipper domain-containing protein [Bradyrhizobium genosp. P]|uniref:leucine zipper domain-containing protein n=1 Tax=Bradyrhizobium genosp. P TaxID=83641 RepID=UPI003CE92883
MARDFQVSAKTMLKRVARFRAEGSVGLDDRSSRPHRIAGTGYGALFDCFNGNSAAGPVSGVAEYRN